MKIVISTEEYAEKVDTKFLVNEKDMQVILDFLRRLHEEKAAQLRVQLTAADVAVYGKQSDSGGN